MLERGLSAWEAQSPVMTKERRSEVTQENTATMNDWMEQAINGGNLQVVDELAHPSYVYRNPTDELRGAEAIKGLFAAYRAAFPDFHVGVDDRVVAGDRMAQAFTITGTHEGEFMGIPPTQRRIRVHGIVMSRFEDGKIVEEWEVIDQLALLQQLGVAS